MSQAVHSVPGVRPAPLPITPASVSLSSAPWDDHCGVPAWPTSHPIRSPSVPLQEISGVCVRSFHSPESFHFIDFLLPSEKFRIPSRTSKSHNPGRLAFPGALFLLSSETPVRETPPKEGLLALPSPPAHPVHLQGGHMPPHGISGTLGSPP